MCSLAAAVQGMDETVNNGAQMLYLKHFNITTKRFSSSEVDNLTGLIVGAPYLACALLGCWLTEPLNRYFARRGTIFISCFIAAVASIWEGVANSWVNLFIARFVLGLGIGSKSSTVPVYSAECAPAPIRGALVMMVSRKSPSQSLSNTDRVPSGKCGPPSASCWVILWALLSALSHQT
jgi:MFS family permease